MRRDLFIIINLCVSVALCFRFFRRRSRLGGRDEARGVCDEARLAECSGDRHIKEPVPE